MASVQEMIRPGKVNI